MPNYQIIDPATWKRKEYLEVYKKAVDPQYSVSFELDVTAFKRYVKNSNLSFTLAFIYAVTVCANEIEEFRCRFLNGDVVVYDSIGTSFTYLDEGSDLFKVVQVPLEGSMEEFVHTAGAAAKSQKEHFTGPVPNDAYQFSALPWISFTHVSHTNFGQWDKAQPIFCWGKFRQSGGRFMMPFSVQVHHAFVDGVHIGRLADRLQHYLDQIEV